MDRRGWGTIVGFLSMIVGSIDPIERRPGGAEILRIYIIGPAQRTGVGRLLLDAAIHKAASEGLSHVWLDVIASATAARRAYATWVFERLADAGSKGPSELPYPTQR